jgi:hypothetical protein
MKFGSVDIPSKLLDALKRGNLIVFAGAGVSMGEPAILPDFLMLASHIAAGTGKTPEEPLDRFLGKLHHDGVDVHSRAATRLAPVSIEPTELHRDLLKLFPAAEHVRLVTTNFDLLFEKAAETLFGEPIEIFRAPALPLGRNFCGIVHLHGAINRAQEMVLTDADFGRAYLTEGWARRFLLDVFRNFTVLFVGYSHDDVVMHYLGRALPVAEVGKRYALTHECDDLQRWHVLGIEPLTYPKSDPHDFSQLNQSIQRMSVFISRNLLDWRRELAEIAVHPPSYSGEEETSVLLALEDVAKTRFFTDHARAIGWLSWLDKRHLLAPLFESGKLSERDTELAWWLAKHYAVRCAPEMFLLIAGHEMKLNPYFWQFLGREVGLNEDYPLDGETLSKWISILLATAPSQLDDHVLLWLGERCIKLNSLQPLLQVFDAMTGCLLSLKRGYMWDDDGQTDEARIEVELQTCGEHYNINELWENGLKSQLIEISEQLLSMVTTRLEKRHYTLCAWDKAAPDWDADNWHRSAIEPHEQDQYPEPIDVLIDAARDGLEWMIHNKPLLAANWCERLVKSEVPLLRRLSIHGSGLRIDFSADDKLSWLQRHVDLHESTAHHEIFVFVKRAYPEASTGPRTSVIESVKCYVWPDQEDEERDHRTAYEQFNWFYWLKNSDPTCELAQQAFDDIKALYPNFKLREHPDMTHWMTSGSYGPQTPWTTEELLSKPAGEWLPDLLTFQGERFSGPDRHGLLNAVTDANKKQFAWGIELAKALAENCCWESDLWSTLFRFWQDADFDKAQHEQIIDWLGRKELHHHHPLNIARALNALAENGGRPYTVDLLPRANAIGSELWQQLERFETKECNDDWLQTAINHPAGVLTQFWLGSLSLWRKEQDPPPVSLNAEYRKTLTRIVEDKSLPGKLGLSIIASQFPFFLFTDRDWTIDLVLPLFSGNEEVQEHQAVWDGFICQGHLNPEVADLLEPAFLVKLSRMEVFQKQRRNRFIEFIAVYLVYYLSSPLTTWIPAFFRHASEDSRVTLASSIKTHIRKIDERHQSKLWNLWLKQYWENRLQGVPVVLSAVEIEQMLGWAPRLPAVFPEAIAMAVRMPLPPLRNFSFLRELSKSKLPQCHPNEVARLLIYLGSSGSPSYVWHGLQEVANKIFSSGISPDLESKLKEVLARLGIGLD